MGKKGYFILTLLINVCLLGCYKEPVFDTKPEISFKEIRKEILIDASTSGIKDSVIIALTFRDGDGDLGYDDTEKNEAVKTNDYNYNIKAYRRKKGVWQEEKRDVNYSGYFSRLRTDNRIGPIEGLFEYGIDFPHAFVIKKDTMKFQIYLKDRTGNLSNTIETKMIILNEF